MSSKIKYIAGGNKSTKIQHSELIVSRMLDFSDHGNNKSYKQI
jgi:hypothetical protein